MFLPLISSRRHIGLPFRYIHVLTDGKKGGPKKDNIAKTETAVFCYIEIGRGIHEQSLCPETRIKERLELLSKHVVGLAVGIP